MLRLQWVRRRELHGLFVLQRRGENNEVQSNQQATPALS